MKISRRAHFLSMAARIRRGLVEEARRKGPQTRRGGPICLTREELERAVAEPRLDLVAVDTALKALAKVDRRQSKVIELRFFIGLTLRETAEALGVSEHTVRRDWIVGRVWLRRQLADGGHA